MQWMSMRRVPLEHDINIAINGRSSWGLRTKNRPFTALLISSSRGTCLIAMYHITTHLTFHWQCLEELPEDLEWKIIYVGSAESEDFDQTLDTVYVGPVPEGRHKFVFEADPPDPAKIPVTDVVGVTVILLTCAYRNQEFIRVGYYVSNDYDDPELTENMPEKPIFDRLTRNILASNPRVTKFKINWHR